MRKARLTLKLVVDVESGIEDDELLEIHGAEVVRQALSREIVTPARGNTGTRLIGIFEGVDARLGDRSPHERERSKQDGAQAARPRWRKRLGDDFFKYCEEGE